MSPLVATFTGEQAVQGNDIYTKEALIELLNHFEIASSPLQRKFLQLAYGLTIKEDYPKMADYAYYFGKCCAFKVLHHDTWRAL